MLALWSIIVLDALLCHSCHSFQLPSSQLGATQGKYAVGPFTDKARIADYVMAKHPDMIGIFPAMAGFYTVFASMPHLRPKCAPCASSLRLLQLLVSRQTLHSVVRRTAGALHGSAVLPAASCSYMHWTRNMQRLIAL